MKRNLFFCFLFCAIGALLKGQIPNSKMELWDSGPVLRHWTTNSKPLTLPPWEPYIVRRDNKAFSGKYAAGFYANGQFRAEASCAFPVKIHPKQLELMYRLSFAPCVNEPNTPNFVDSDTVRIAIDILYKGQVVDSGRWESSLNAPDYTKLVVKLTQSSTQFDSCRIRIMGGLVYGGCGTFPEATYLLVDDLKLRYSEYPECIDPNLICSSCFCPEYIDPVCGCDGVTYGNTCEALRAGVTSWDSGQCADTLNTCLDSALLCPLCPCPAVFAPVCACDSITYENSCMAENAGVKYWTNGPCRAGINCNARFNHWFDPLEKRFHFSYAGFFTDSLLFNWNFGDGNTATAPYTSHLFSDTTVSTWEVCLEVNNLSGTCTEKFCDIVKIAEMRDECHAGFGLTMQSDGTITLSSNGDHPESNSYWFRGDSTISSSDSVIVEVDTTNIGFICHVLVNDSLKCRDTVCISSEEIYRTYQTLFISKSLKLQPRLLVYPNPAGSADLLNIVSNLSDDRYALSITDLTGRTIHQQNIQLINGRCTLSSHPLPSAGIYFIELRNQKDFQKTTLIYTTF
jgi:hypothetical protein